ISQQGSEFSVLNEGQKIGNVNLPMPGQHMIENALGCIAVCVSIGITFEVIAKALLNFGGVAQRWKDHGVINGVRIIEDFAHHPTALRANIETANLFLPEGGRLILGFQPQLFSRTQRFAKAYSDIIRTCDAAFLLEIDASGEKNPNTVGSQIIIDHLREASPPVSLSSSPDDLVQNAISFLKPNDIILLAGGADIARTARLVVSQMVEGLKTTSLCRRLLSVDCRQLNQPSIPEKVENALTLIARNFSTVPSATAVCCGAESISYHELNVISYELSLELRARGIGTGSVVAIGLPASIDQVSLQIAVLRAGGTCLTLDEKLPAERLSYMLDIARAALVVTQNGSRIDETLDHAAKIHFEKFVSDCVHNLKGPFFSNHKMDGEPQGDDIAHICFTSGTTGWPKGIPTTHAALFALLQTAIERFGMTNATRTVLNSSLNFDASIAEIMLTLSAGGTLCIPENKQVIMGRNLCDFINRNEITHLFATPSVLSTLPPSSMKSLQTVVAGGEVCSQELADTMSSNCQFFNAYGPSEAAIYSTAWEYTKENDVCIGQPLAHIDLHILNPQGGTVDRDGIGEIFLSGIGVCRRYLGDPELYRDRFVTVKDQDGASVQAYRTGDLARVRTDGQIEFIGRIDNQIKIRGNRIELEEIEATFMRIDFIADAVACIERTDHGSKIVAFYTSRDNVPKDVCDVSQALARSLPDYMSPSTIVEIEEIPMTLTGKKDRIETARRHRHKTFAQDEFIAPVNETQERLANLWRAVLAVDHPVGQIHNFVRLGGDSLKQVTLTMKVEDAFQIIVPPGFFGMITNLRAMAKLVDELIETAMNRVSQNHATPLSDHIYSKQLEFTSGWAGRRHEPQSLIVSVGSPDAEFHLFWCLQAGIELASIANALGPNYCVHGMRSGHLIMAYSDENLARLSQHYALEISKFYPKGTLSFGGNCQGGQVAHAVAGILQKQGRDIKAL
ncbi:MAG TPA: hypothetical protein DCE52_11980, partial [Rhodobacteraceae bacterium]|nr:hypothetical protein [Paracoccaceae bacterium]